MVPGFNEHVKELPVVLWLVMTVLLGEVPVILVLEEFVCQ